MSQSVSVGPRSASEYFERDFKRAYLDDELDSGSSFQRSQTLGFGASGAVFKVTNTDLSTTHALKCLSKLRPREKFANEVDIMQAIGYHPNIVSLVFAFEDRNYYNIVMELCKGGELTDVLIKSPFTEQQASYYLRQILSAVQHCHERDIVHRDIKPGNFIVQETPDAKDGSSVLKMIDFGTALRVKDNELVKGRAGTLLYSAPELFSSQYRRGRTGNVLKASDMWSLGVLLFVMVCGRPPFEAANSDDLIDLILSGKFQFPSIAMSDSVKDLISRILVVDPKKRFTAAQALQHPWVVNAAAVPISGEVIVSLEAFVTKSKLKKLVGKVMANQLTLRDENYLLGVFTHFDRDGDGRLGLRELIDFMRHLGHSTVDSEIEADGVLGLYSAPSGALIPSQRRILAATTDSSASSASLANTARVNASDEPSTAVVIHPPSTRSDGLNFAGFEAMYTTGRLSVSRQAVLESFQHFDVGHKGYISRHDLETRAEEQAFDSPRLLKRVRSDDEEEIQDRDRKSVV